MVSRRRIELGAGPVSDEVPGFGIPALDDLLSRLFWGDNVVWRLNDISSSDAFADAVIAAAATVGAYLDVRPLTPGSAAITEAESPPDEHTLLVVDLRGGAHDLDVPGLIRHVFTRKVVCFWLLEASSEPDWLAHAQCVITIEGPNLRVDRADGRSLGVCGTMLPFTIENNAGEPRLDVKRAPAGALLGRGIRRLRRERGWSQAEVGSLIGVSGSAISQAERGILSLSLESVLELSGRLGVPVDALLRGPAERHSVTRHPIGDTDSHLHADDPHGPAGSHLRTTTLAVPPGASASATAPHASTQLLLVAHGLIQAQLPDATPLLRAGDRLSTVGADLRGVRNVGPDEALLFWVSSAS